MKFFTNKNIWTKIIIVLIFVILFEFIVAKPTLASGALEFGGKLLSPFLDLVVSLGDGVIGILHSSIMGADQSLISIDLSSHWWEILGRIIIIAIVVAISVALVCTGGGIVAIITGIAKVALAGTVATMLWDATGTQTGISKVKAAGYTQETLPDTLLLPAYTLSPEEIFKGNILLFNVNFFHEGEKIKEHKIDVKDKNGQKTGEQEVDYYYYINDNGEEVKTSKQDIASDLRGTISAWYVSIRNIVLVCMMIVLLYIAIRILLSTLASDKAKYKQMLQDWVIGMLLVFFMHYIMVFSITIVEKVTEIVSTSTNENGYMSIIPFDKNNKMSNFIDENPELEQYVQENNGEKYLYYPTNLMGYIRIRAELANWGTEYIGMSLCFLILVLYTLFFCVTYLKRLIYMAFLTLIAPVVALTYPIDKINDGKAQGFDKWFKEYIFNLLIQPLHLLLYYILVTSAFNLVSENVVYALVALGFMIPAEKLLRSFFGFEKAHTPGMFAGPAGAALTMSAINKISGLGKGSKSGRDGSKSSSGADSDSYNENSRPPRMESNVNEKEEILNMSDGNDEAPNNSKVLDTNYANNDNNNDNNEELDTSKINNENPFNNEKTPEEMAADDPNYIYMHPELFENNNEEKERVVPEQQDENIKESRIRKLANSNLARRAKRRVSASFEGAKSNLKTTLKNAPKDLTKGAIRGGIKFTAATTAASLGLAAGVASGDPNKAFQYTTTAGMAGATLGGNIANNLMGGIPKTKEYKEAFDRTYNSQKYDDLAREDYIKSFKKENKTKIRQTFEKDKAKEMLEKGGNVDKFIDGGIDNIDDMITAQQMIDDKKVSGTREAIAVAKYAKRVGDDYNNTNATKWEERFTKEFKDTAGASDTQAKKAARKTMKQVEVFNKTKKKISK